MIDGMCLVTKFDGPWTRCNEGRWPGTYPEYQGRSGCEHGAVLTIRADNRPRHVCRIHLLSSLNDLLGVEE